MNPVLLVNSGGVGGIKQYKLYKCMVICRDFPRNLCILWVGVTQRPLPFNPPSYVEVLILHLHWDYWAHAPRERWDVHVLNSGMNRGSTGTSQEVGGFQCLITMVLEPGRQQQLPPKKRIHLRKMVDFVLKLNVFFCFVSSWDSSQCRESLLKEQRPPTNGAGLTWIFGTAEIFNSTWWDDTSSSKFASNLEAKMDAV